MNKNERGNSLGKLLHPKDLSFYRSRLQQKLLPGKVNKMWAHIWSFANEYDFETCEKCGSVVDIRYKDEHEKFHAQIDALSNKVKPEDSKPQFSEEVERYNSLLHDHSIKGACPHYECEWSRRD